MFEVNKLPALALVLLLLAPFFILFWRFTSWNVEPESLRRAELEREVIAKYSVQRPLADSDQPSIARGIITTIQVMPFTERSPYWLSFYPRKWVGWLGLAATTAILMLAVLCLFFPGPNSVSVSYPASPEFHHSEQKAEPASPVDGEEWTPFRYIDEPEEPEK